MDKENWKNPKKLLRYIFYTFLCGIAIALFIPPFSDACYEYYLRFKELRGTISVSEKNYLEEQRRLALIYWW